jgi:imidazole glycerol-phosphate synthase subunit HisF
VLRKRIIFTLIYENGLFNQSRNFRLQKVGNIDWLEKNYRLQDIAFSLDEIVVLNASRGDKDIKRFATILNRLVDDVFIPIAAGGGVNSIADAETLFENGADKIVLNSALYENPNMVKEIVQHYGKQSVVASVDYADNEVFIENGSKKIDMLLGQYIEYIESLGVGEIYLNSIIRDGTGFGYDIDTIQQVSSKIKVPLIVAGGAGNEKHLLEAIEIEGVSAIATANLFNFMGDGLPKARKAMVDKGVNLVNWR